MAWGIALNHVGFRAKSIARDEIFTVFARSFIY